MKNILSEIVSSEIRGKRSLLYRSEEERKFLVSWLRKPETETAEETFSDISSLVESCSRCPQAVNRKKGFGTGSNGVMIILNAPRMVNRVEINIHRSESAALLRKMIGAIGLELEDCYTTNLVKCECRDPLFKPSDMVKNCIEILRAELNHHKPSIALIMGDILPLQDIIHHSSDTSWFNTEHTISLIKNPELKRGAWETLKLIREKFREVKQ